MDRKSASAYQIKDTIFIRGDAFTTDGLRMGYGLLFTSETSDLVQLGENILKAIEGAGKIIPHPTQEEWKEIDKSSPILKASKMKTWNALMKASKRVTIIEMPCGIEFLPLRFRGATGPNRGYDFLEDKAIICTDLDPKTLGKALLQAFDLCE